jgi:hypothetical protein
MGEAVEIFNDLLERGRDDRLIERCEEHADHKT